MIRPLTPSVRPFVRSSNHLSFTAKHVEAEGDKTVPRDRTNSQTSDGHWSWKCVLDGRF